MWDQKVFVWWLVYTARQGRTCWGRLAPSLSELWPTMTFPRERLTYRLLSISGAATFRLTCHQANTCKSSFTVAECVGGSNAEHAAL